LLSKYASNLKLFMLVRLIMINLINVNQHFMKNSKNLHINKKIFMGLKKPLWVRLKSTKVNDGSASFFTAGQKYARDGSGRVCSGPRKQGRTFICYPAKLTSEQLNHTILKGAHFVTSVSLQKLIDWQLLTMKPFNHFEVCVNSVYHWIQSLKYMD